MKKYIGEILLFLALVVLASIVWVILVSMFCKMFPAVQCLLLLTA